MLKKYIILFVLFLATADLFSQVPAISSFSPASGPAGTTVTITGTNFSPTPVNNIVYFGAVKALVTNATNTLLTVIAPVGASYKSITVTVNSLTGYSRNPFVITFNNVTGEDISSSAFEKFHSTGIPASFQAIGDIDGDGKPDIVSINGGLLSVLRNTSFPSTISFSSQNSDFANNITFQGTPTIADVDGDGRLDIITVSYANSTVSIFRNISDNGTIAFATRVDIATELYPFSVVVGDIDGDGKPELIVGNTYQYNNANTKNSISVYKNNTISGDITASSFAPRLNLAYPLDYYYGFPEIGISDLDGDGKPDIVVVNGYGSLSVYHNTANIGSIISSSLERLDFKGYSAGGIAIGDIDNTGKPDLITTNQFGGTFIDVIKNVAIAGIIDSTSFAKRSPFVTFPGSCNALSIADMNGDGKIDIVGVGDTNTLIILKNKIIGDNITDAAFVNKIIYSNIQFDFLLFNYINVADIDGDGKPDIIFGEKGYKIAIYRNKIGDSIFSKLCPPNDNIIFTCNLPAASYQWQADIGNGFVNISNNNYYNGTKTNTLQLTQVPSSWYGYKYRCVTNEGGYDKTFTLQFSDTWAGTVNDSWEIPANWSCGTLPDGNTDVVINSGNVIINSNVTVKSLTVGPNATVTVNEPYTLTVLH